LLNQILKEDPLDFWARNEKIGTLKPDQFDSSFQELSQLMRGDPQNFLELAINYANLGFWGDAVNVLNRAVSLDIEAARFPMVHYYLGFYHQKMGNKDLAKKHFETASSLPTDYCFPFRLESSEVLQAAIDSNPNDSKAYYYLGNLYYEIQPEVAIKAWEKSRELEPGLALTHRNLGWAYLRFEGDTLKASESYEMAIKANPNDPRFFLELDQIYEVLNVSPEKRMALLESNQEIVESANYSFLREIMVRVLVGQYEQAIEDLDSNYFHVREGGGEIHDVFVDAHLLKGLNDLKQGDTDAALAEFLRASEYPENLSVGVPRRDRRLPQVAYYTGLAYSKKGEAEKAREFFLKSAESALPGSWSESRFYQALSMSQLGKGSESEKIFQSLIDSGQRILSEKGEVDFFAKFGEMENEGARKARGYYILGLGQLGKGLRKEAAESFRNSVELNASNVWAKYQVEELM
jgi:tetratricopeptide (TPR) repeat protein